MRAFHITERRPSGRRPGRRGARHSQVLLKALGHDPDHELELSRTPALVTEAFENELGGYSVDVRSLLAAEWSPIPKDGARGPVIVRGITVTTICPHHLLPASGHATVAYLWRSTDGHRNRRQDRRRVCATAHAAGSNRGSGGARARRTRPRARRSLSARTRARLPRDARRSATERHGRHDRSRRRAHHGLRTEGRGSDRRRHGL